ncbi:hypothetical protein NUACC26_082730 [Scytonema sp. NUACC26]
MLRVFSTFLSYVVHKLDLPPLIPPMYWGEIENLVPSPIHRGGLGWGKTSVQISICKLFQTCMYTLAFLRGASALLRVSPNSQRLAWARGDLDTTADFTKIL